MRDSGTSVILSTHNMESVEELCDNIALINKSKLIITGELDQIRKDHGKNEIEVIYRAPAPNMFAGNGLITLVGQDETKRGYRAVLEVKKEACSAEILRTLVNEVDILSYRELIPRMNDIFIKLVS
jgi:ABC-2 type transport system ATP-binding protein